MNQSDANTIVRQAWAAVFGVPASDSEAAYTQAVAWFENQYGRAGQFGPLAAAGQFNWGSLHAAGTPPNCPAGSAPGSDVGKVCFRVFPTDVAAAGAFVRELAQNPKYNRAKVRAAMAGSPEDVAQAMFDTHYYQGAGATDAIKVQNYANGIRSALKTIGQGGAVPNVTPSAASSTSKSLVLLVATGAGAYWLFGMGGLKKVRRIPVVRSGTRAVSHAFTGASRAARRLV
jgi:hypothetical protein